MDASNDKDFDGDYNIQNPPYVDVPTPSPGDVPKILSRQLSIVQSDTPEGNASVNSHGWMPKLSGNDSDFLRGDGEWATPAGTGGGNVTSNTSTSVDSQVALFSGSSGKEIKPASITGIAKLTAGVLSGVTTTGAGSVVLDNSPTLITPVLGVATSTSINKIVFTAPTTAATIVFNTDNTTQTFQGTDTIVGRATTDTLTNKRITKRTGTTTSSATPTINTDNVDFYSITAQTVDITSFTTNLSGTPTEAQTLWIAITGTASRALTFGTSFEASTVALPTTTSSTNRLDIGFVFNTVTNKWRCIAVA